jgi:hypothetical protein
VLLKWIDGLIRPTFPLSVERPFYKITDEFGFGRKLGRINGNGCLDFIPLLLLISTGELSARFF